MDSETLPTGVPTGDGSAKVFISYAYQDREVAQRIAEALSSRGIDVWSDRQISVGQSFASEIATHIEDADTVLVLMSPASASSQAVSTEVALAVAATLGDSGKKILPVLIDGDSSDVVPPLLLDRVYLDLRGKSEDSAKLDELANLVAKSTSHDMNYQAARELTEKEIEAVQLEALVQAEIATAARGQVLAAWIGAGFAVLLAAGIAIAAAIFAVNGSGSAAWVATAANVICVGVAWRISKASRTEYGFSVAKDDLEKIRKLLKPDAEKFNR